MSDSFGSANEPHTPPSVQFSITQDSLLPNSREEAEKCEMSAVPGNIPSSPLPILADSVRQQQLGSPHPEGTSMSSTPTRPHRPAPLNLDKESPLLATTPAAFASRYSPAESVAVSDNLTSPIGARRDSAFHRTRHPISSPACDIVPKDTDDQWRHSLSRLSRLDPGRPIQDPFQTLSDEDMDHKQKELDEILGQLEQEKKSGQEGSEKSEPDYFSYDQDDAEDVMNMPGKSALRRGSEDSLSHLFMEGEPMSEASHHLHDRRVELEAGIEKELTQHGCEESVGMRTDHNSEMVTRVPQEIGITLPLKDGGVIEDADQQEGGVIRDKNAAESIFDAHSSPTAVSSGTPVISRRYSSPTGQHVSTFDPTSSPIFGFSPKDKHVLFDQQFQDQTSPFTKTLKTLKQFQGKENSPSKSRRNASLPEEIAELAKEAQQNELEEENEKWRKYREIDLAPVDTVMEDRIAGDLIMTGSTTSDNVHTWADGETNEEGKSTIVVSQDILLGEFEGTTYELNIPGHSGQIHKLVIKTLVSVEELAVFIMSQGKALGATEEDIDHAVQAFLAAPDQFIVPEKINAHVSPDAEQHAAGPMAQELDGRNANLVKMPYPQKDFHEPVQSGNVSDSSGVQDSDEGGALENQLIVYREEPAFINAIGMIPMAIFWAVTQPIAHYSDKALDKVLEKLGVLSLD